MYYVLMIFKFAQECFWTSARQHNNFGGKDDATTCQPHRHFGALKTLKATGKPRYKTKKSSGTENHSHGVCEVGCIPPAARASLVHYLCA